MPTLQYTWQPPISGPPDSYNVYEGTQPGTEAFLLAVPGTQTTYSHVRAAGPYSAYVTAVTAGLESGPSNETTGNVLLPTPTLTATGETIGGVPAILLSVS